MVKTLSSCLVAPQAETPNHGIWLSNLDLLVARAHTPTVYVYKPNGSPNFFSVEVLKTALRNALVLFYPFAGRLGLDQDGRLEINCNGEGALFVEAQSESTMDEFGDFAPDPKSRQLLVPSADSGDPPCILLLIQVTFFKCGGVCLGVAVHHTLADGLGALHFINAWSDLARGIEVVPPPFLDRSLLRAREPPTVIFEHTEYHQSKQGPKLLTQATKPFSSAILKLSKDQLAALKRTGLSSFRAVVAHVWRCACKARGLAGDQLTRLYMTADARTRVTPPLPPGYLGNAIFRSSAASTAGEIMSESIEFAANKIRDATSRLNDEHVRSLVDFLELHEDLRRLAKGSWTLPATDLWVISWQGLPIYEADFGWGRPIFMGRASLQFSGLVYIMQNPNSDGGLSLAVALEPEHMLPFRECFFDGLGAVGEA